MSILRSAIAALACSAPIPAEGAQWFLLPAVTARLGYETNIDLQKDDPIDSSRLDLEVMLRGGRVSERARLTGLFQAAARRYLQDDSFDSDDFSAGLNASYLVTELDELGIDLKLARDTSLISELATTGNIRGNVPRLRAAVSPYWQRRLSERSTLGLSLGYSNVTYDDNDFDLVDYEQTEAEGTYSFRLSERLTLNGTLGAVSYESDDDESYVSYSASLGAAYAVSETMTVGFFVGPELVRSSGDGDDGDDESSGAIYGIDVRKEFERGAFGLQLRRGAVPTGEGKPLLQESLSLDFDYRLSPRISFALPASIYRNEDTGIDSGSDFDRRIFFSTEPSLRWRVTQDVVLIAAYRYRYQDEDATGATDSNAVFVSLSYIWPLRGSGS
jgi:opacity protein-like surface antigen